jgi:hypothetical protein
MKKLTYYNQCKLVKENTHQVTWLPEKYAVVGESVKLKQKDGSWSDGWLVVSAGARQPHDEMMNFNKAIKEHRKRTGDSLPKNK